MQCGIRRAASLEIREIDADDQQGFLPLGRGTVGDHAVQIRSQGRSGTGLLGTFRQQQRRDGLGFIGVANHPVGAKGDHRPIRGSGLLLRFAHRLSILDPGGDLRRLQHAAGKFRKREFAIERHPVDGDVVAGRHRNAAAVGVSIKHPAVLQGCSAGRQAAAVVVQGR